MLISIVIPAYNAEKYIHRCLTSILSQPTDNVEVIVIDDASSDKTREILERFKERDTRLRVCTNSETKLAGYSRNLGIGLAKGDYLWFVDADDWISPEAIEHLSRIIAAHPAADVWSFGFAIQFATGDYSVLYKIPSPRLADQNALVNFFMIRNGYSCMPFSYLFKREFLLFNSLDFPTGIYFEDLLFMGRVFYHVRNIKLIPRIFYHYERTNKGSVTLVHSKKKILDLLEAYDRLKEFLPEKSLLNYRGLLSFRFVLYGLPRCFRMYYGLAGNERRDPDLRRRLFAYKNTGFMTFETLRNTWLLSRKLAANDLLQRKEFRMNLWILFQVKYASWWLAIRIRRVGISQNFGVLFKYFRTKFKSLQAFNRLEV